MRMTEIRRMPTTLDMVHESVFRSYHIVEKVGELLKHETPAEVILELIEDMQTEPLCTELPRVQSE